MTRSRVQVHRSQYLELSHLASRVSCCQSTENLCRTELFRHLSFLHPIMIAQSQMVHQLTKLQGIQIYFLHPRDLG